MAETLEDKVEQSEEKKDFFSTLQSFSPLEWATVGAAGALGAASGGGLKEALIPGIGSVPLGPLNAGITMGSYVTANGLAHAGEGFTKNQLKTELYLGAALTPIYYAIFSALGTVASSLTYLGIAVAGLLPFTIIVNSTKYFIEKYNPWTALKSLYSGEALKDLYTLTTDVVPKSFKPGLVASGILAPIVTAVSTIVPTQYMVATLAPVRTLYRYVIEKFKSTPEPLPQAA